MLLDNRKTVLHRKPAKLNLICINEKPLFLLVLSLPIVLTDV